MSVDLTSDFFDNEFGECNETMPGWSAHATKEPGGEMIKSQIPAVRLTANMGAAERPRNKRSRVIHDDSDDE